MIIYADVLFIINFITSYIILFILGKIIIKVKIKKIRLAISSVVGGVAAVVVFSLELPVLVMQIIRVVSSFFMVFSKNSVGTNALIKEGAILIDSISDII